MEYEPLIEKLKRYADSDCYPFHMPGHKRRGDIFPFPNPYDIDITEIEGFDNLHRPEGILKASMSRAAGIYGSDFTYYLVNGSTCGILSAICACVKPGETFLMARNSHKAAYHAVFINNLNPVYAYPEIWGEYRLSGGIDPAQAERILEKEKGIRAVYLTSPTYEGMVSDVEKIASLAHKYGIPLIVDEAHGAHLSFGGDAFPKSALDCGADLVVQSLHKTLPSLTQTAVLHLKSRLIRPEQIERYLSLFQSSSPSYVLLSSIDSCVAFMEREGRERIKEFGERLKRWEAATDFKRLSLVPFKKPLPQGTAGRDPSKLVISTLKAGISGTALARILRERYHLEPELACEGHVLLMASFMDREEGLTRLAAALSEIDGTLQIKGVKIPAEKGARCLTCCERTIRCMSIFDAGHAPCGEVPLEDAAGCVSGGFLTVYPPGVPAVVPGELITKELADLLQANKEAGQTVEGLSAEHKISVVAERLPGTN